MTTKNSNELHSKISKLRNMNKYPKKHVADYLKIDILTYEDYEAGRRTPDITKLRNLAELYKLEDELLGSEFPIEAHTEYPSEMLDNLEQAIKNCKQHSANNIQDQMEVNKLKDALKPVLEIKGAALDMPSIIGIREIPPNTTVKKVDLDMRAENLITMCLDM